MKDITYIEPCCAERQLPALMREKFLACFQTNGDVSFEHFMKAVSCVAGNELEISLMVPQLDTDMLRVLAWFGRRGWLKKLSVLTHDNQSSMVASELNGNVPEFACYNCDRITDCMLVIRGEQRIVVLQGELFSGVHPGYRFYTVANGQDTAPHLRMLTATFSAFFNRRYKSKKQKDEGGENNG